MDVTKFTFDLPEEGMGRSHAITTGGAGGVPHDMGWDHEDNVIFGISGGTVLFNPETEEFRVLTDGPTMR